MCQYLENCRKRYVESYYLWLTGSRMYAFDWHQDRWPWMTLNSISLNFQRISRNFADFGRNCLVPRPRSVSRYTASSSVSVSGATASASASVSNPAASVLASVSASSALFTSLHIGEEKGKERGRESRPTVISKSRCRRMCGLFSSVLNIHCVSKKGPTLKRYSSKLYGSILMIFGGNIQKSLE